MGDQQGSSEKTRLISLVNKEGYFVDAEGFIYSQRRGKMKKLSLITHYGRSKNPYLRVKMGGKLHMAHRIILEAKIGRELNCGEFANHINGDTTDNRMVNLEVTTHRENVEHAVSNGLYCSGEDWYKARGLRRNAENLQRLGHGVQNGQ